MTIFLERGSIILVTKDVVQIKQKGDEKRMIAKITRTVFRRKVTLTWFNETTREVTETTHEIYENLTEGELVKRMEKTGENNVSVLDINLL